MLSLILLDIITNSYQGKISTYSKKIRGDQCFTLFEKHLKSICQIYEKMINSEIKFEDINSQSDIDVARKYMKKVVGLNFPDNHRTFEKLEISDA